MVALAAMLFVVSSATTLLTGDWPTSISAYYGGTVRDVLVGVLFGIAACLVAYRGANPLEDFALNAAGFYVLLVALIPTNLAEILIELRTNTGVDDVTVEDYVSYLRVTVAVVLLFCAVLAWREVRISRRLGDLWTGGKWSRRFIIISTIALGAFLVLAAARLYLVSFENVTMEGFQLGGFRLRVHDLAAILLIASLAVAVWSHGWPDKSPKWKLPVSPAPNSPTYQKSYRTIFALMTLGAVVVGVIGGAWLHLKHTIALLEWWEIALFIAFWLLAIKHENKDKQVAAGSEKPLSRET